MRKTFLLVIVLSLLLTGCHHKEEADMGKLGKDGNYHYQNKGLGFNIDLPPEFQYYQVQRKDNLGYIDIEFFVPTSDTEYPQEVQSYAKPIIVRVFDKSAWDGIIEEDRFSWEEIGDKNEKVYTIKFWESIPVDWEGKWSDDMKMAIKDNFDDYKIKQY